MKKRLLALCVSFTLLGVIYYAQHNNINVLFSKRFLNINPGEIVFFTINWEGKSYSFARHNKKWKLEKPAAKSMEQRPVDYFLKDLCTLPLTQTISENSDEAAAYGLENPRIRIQMVYGSAIARIVVLLGCDNEAGTSIYAKKSDSAKIVLLGRIIKEDVAQLVHMIDS
jgi:hypothetical protein